MVSVLLAGMTQYEEPALMSKTAQPGLLERVRQLFCTRPTAHLVGADF